MEKLDHPLWYAGLGALRAVFGNAVEHPFYVLKARAQFQIHLSHMDVFSDLYKTKGLRGFADGFLPNLKMNIIKEGARWPIIYKMYGVYKEHFGVGLASKLATGFTTAAFETALLPFNRLFMAKVNENGYRWFYENRMKNTPITTVLSSLYSGKGVTFLYRGSAWSIFITSDYVAKQTIKRWDKDNNHPFIGGVFSTGFTTLSLSTIALPIDFAKTRVQIDTTNTLGKMRLIDLLKTLHATWGLKGFYKGIGFDISRRFVHVALTKAFFDKVTGE